MASADGRLDGAWLGRLEAHVADDGAIERVHYVFGDKLPPNTDPGANAAYGFPNDAISSFDFASVNVDITVSTAGADGTVGLFGYDSPDDCDEAPPDEPGSDPDPGADPSDPDEGSGMGSSSPGCRSADLIVVASGNIE
jgi:hypothetical protein